uniref:dTDP-4-dehydrorhamnose reductase n=1 Tax=Candidatus Kentrum sp. DK TaxID=2126562 RepID=A0A450SBJ9_9GAMM|nr:MAG: dTDP-4-dehydrorhamnose reductase [Candidatus Kentron sp. DK]
MKILLTGKNGQVGRELQRTLAPLGEVVAVGRADCDLARPDEIRSLVRGVEPDVIVNPAAYTAVDRAETEKESAFAVNGVAPGILGEEAAGLSALVVHYSTDYVFDGEKATPYTEDDIPNPLNVYGASKLAGERALRESGADHLILRTGWVFGAHGNNFPKTILRLAGEKASLNVVADQFGAPTSAALIAEVTGRILRRYRQADREAPTGVYHLVAGGVTTWHGCARAVVEIARGMGGKLELDPENVRPVTTAEYPLPARRPANSRLDTHKLENAFALRLPGWRVGLEQVLGRILSSRGQ